MGINKIYSSGACIFLKEGDKEANVCVAPSKDLGKKDIIWVEKDRAQSLRSTTETVNKMLKFGASMEDIDRTLEVLNKQLRAVSDTLIETKAGPLERKRRDVV